MKAVARSSTSARLPSTCSWKVSGRPPMKGSLNRVIDGAAAACALGAALAPPRVAEALAACGLVIVVDCALAGRVTAFGLPPPSRAKNPANEDLGFIACALAIAAVSLRADFQEPLLTNESGQIELEPAGPAGVAEDPAHPRRGIGRSGGGR